MVYNIMTCEGAWSMGFLGGCSMAWLTLALIVLLGLILRKQTEDDGIFSGINFNPIFSFILGVGGAIVVITLFGSVRWAFLIGILGLGLGGYVGGLIFGGEN